MARQKISLKTMFFGYMEILSVWVSEEDLERALMFKYPKKTKIHASPPQKLATLLDNLSNLYILLKIPLVHHISVSVQVAHQI